MTNDISQLTAADIMVKRVITIDQGATIMEAVRELYTANVGALAVLDGKTMVGIFTERDILRRVIPKEMNMDKAKVSEVMTPEPLTATLEMPITEVYKLMNSMNVRHIPVLNGDKLAGMISLKDIAEACMK